MKRICIVTSSPLTIRAFLQDQIAALSLEYDVWVVANFLNVTELGALPASVHVFPVRLERDIAPLRDIRALARLVTFFRAYRFDSVHSVTPKAGLLAMIASYIARTPVRVHTFTGQVWATRTGWARRLLKGVDRLYASIATRVFVDSPSQRDFLLREHVITAKKSTVFASGSISGVDTRRFAPDHLARHSSRESLGLTEDDILFLFLGRLKREKGVPELIRAFRDISDEWSNAYLWLVGTDEEGLLTSPTFNNLVRTRHGEHTDQPEWPIGAADVLCLPSHREGFGTVVIEAACAGVPAIGSRIYGLTDAILDGETGLLFRTGDVADLKRCMTLLLSDSDLRLRLGTRARERALDEFPKERLTQEIVLAYEHMLGGT